jgi:hypothetical protein
MNRLQNFTLWFNDPVGEKLYEASVFDYGFLFGIDIIIIVVI